MSVDELVVVRLQFTPHSPHGINNVNSPSNSIAVLGVFPNSVKTLAPELRLLAGHMAIEQLTPSNEILFHN